MPKQKVPEHAKLKSMFDPLNVNWLAVFVAAAVGLAVGIAWYAPPILGNRARQAAVPTPGRDPKAAAASIVTVALMAYVLALVLGAMEVSSVLDGAIVGVVAWLGFVFTTVMAIALFERRSFLYVAVTAGQPLLALVAMGAVIGAWR
jgi:ethanolamine transporter EutH